jgi:FkbM family methyltransferase
MAEVTASLPAQARVPRAIARRLRRLQWSLVRALTPRRRVTARGLSFMLPCDNAITELRWRTFETKEPETLAWIDELVRDGDVVVDVGANIGLYSLYAALRHLRARVIAFEPEYANLHLLRDNIVGNGLGGRIEPYALALGERSGLSLLHLHDLTPGAALHSEAAEARTRTDSGHPVLWAEGICVMRLDDFCAERGVTPNAIKIDVDGGERRVLEGARATLAAADLRTVLIELPDDHAERDRCARLLGDAGLQRAPRAGGSANEIWRRDTAAVGVPR